MSRSRRRAQKPNAIPDSANRALITGVVIIRTQILKNIGNDASADLVRMPDEVLSLHAAETGPISKARRFY